MMHSFATGSPRFSGPTLSRLIGLACSVAFILFGYGKGSSVGVLVADDC